MINIKLVLKTYALVLGIFAIFRLILFFTGLSYITPQDSIVTILHAFFNGLRFDLVISGYILFFPFLALSVIAMIRPSSALPAKILFYLLFILFTLAFIVCAADIPYFNQFFMRMNVGGFSVDRYAGICLQNDF